MSPNHEKTPTIENELFDLTLQLQQSTDAQILPFGSFAFHTLTNNRFLPEGYYDGKDYRDVDVLAFSDEIEWKDLSIIGRRLSRESTFIDIALLKSQDNVFNFNFAPNTPIPKSILQTVPIEQEGNVIYVLDHPSQFLITIGCNGAGIKFLERLMFQYGFICGLDTPRTNRILDYSKDILLDALKTNPKGQIRRNMIILARLLFGSSNPLLPQPRLDVNTPSNRRYLSEEPHYH